MNSRLILFQRSIVLAAALGMSCAATAQQLWTDPPRASDPAAPPAQDWIATGFAGDQDIAPLADKPVFTPPDPNQPLAAANERPGFRTKLELFGTNVAADYRNFYSCTGLLQLAGGVGVNAVLANTSLDIQFRNWYQDRMVTHGSDQFAKTCKKFGEVGIMVPAFAGLAIVGNVLDDWFDDQPVLATMSDYSTRVVRGYLVGAPPMLTLQFVLGAGRPTSGPSYWQPFQHDNGVSGHAFTGAVPFITAAKMVDNPFLKGGFYALSTFPAWSRVNDNAHYLSQVVLGWWIGYLAANAVDQTESQRNKHFEITPVCSPDMTGVMFTWSN